MNCVYPVARTIQSPIFRSVLRLAAEWRSGRGHSSLSSEMVTHPAYLQIIGMGKSAIPLLLNGDERATRSLGLGTSSDHGY